MKIIKYMLYISGFLFIGAFSCLNNPGQNKPTLNAAKPIITVYVPGTQLTPTFLSKKYFNRIEGLQKITAYEETSNCRKIAETLTKTNPHQYDLEKYYYFGWNGKLCFKERKLAAKELYTKLEALCFEHHKLHGENPVFRIITHSHGGNVFLNLANVIPKNSKLVIEEAILLACPVQEKTKHLIASTRFKRIYAFYSSNDMIQILDPQGWYKKSKSTTTFSARRFPQSNNLRQACIQLNGRNPMHIDFFLPKFMTNLPAICEKIDGLYETIPAEYATYEKQLDVRCNQGPITIHEKLL